jgi:hypothetical protein
MHRLDTRQSVLGRWDCALGWPRPTGISSVGHVILRAVRSEKSYSFRRPRSDTFLWAGGQSDGHTCRPRKWRDNAAAHRRKSALQSNITILSPPRATLSNSWVPTSLVPLGIVTKLPQPATSGERQSGRRDPLSIRMGLIANIQSKRRGQEPGCSGSGLVAQGTRARL